MTPAHLTRTPMQTVGAEPSDAAERHVSTRLTKSGGPQPRLRCRCCGICGRIAGSLSAGSSDAQYVPGPFQLQKRFCLHQNYYANSPWTAAGAHEQLAAFLVRVPRTSYVVSAPSSRGSGSIPSGSTAAETGQDISASKASSESQNPMECQGSSAATAA